MLQLEKNGRYLPTDPEYDHHPRPNHVGNLEVESFLNECRGGGPEGMIWCCQSTHESSNSSVDWIGFDQPSPACQQLLHHALLELASFGQALFQGLDFGIHVREDGGNGGLF